VKQKLEFLRSVENKSYRETEKHVRALTGESQMTEVKLDDEAMALLQRFKELTAHQNPWADTNTAIKLALTIAIQQKNPALNLPKKNGYCKNVETRAAGKILKHQVWVRDSGQCTAIDPKTGKRCDSRFKLELDHVEPFSRGGETTQENLRLLCRAHHQRKSE